MSGIRTAIDVALLKHSTMHHVAGDKNKTMFALGVIIVAALLSGIGLRYFGGFLSLSIAGIITSAIFQIVSTIIGLYVLSIVATSLFKGHAKHDAFFRVMGFGLIVTWLSVIPVLGIIGGVWALVILFSALKVIHKLTTGAALGTIVVSIVVMFIVNLILIPAFALVGISGQNALDFGSFRGDGFNMNFRSDEGTSSVEMDDGKMTITGPDGEVLEIEIPSQ